jgi:ribosomal protein S6E (S10)
MGTWDRIRAALRREKRELDDVVGDAKARANATLDQRERELKATPEERLAMEQERGAQIDDDFDAVRRRIEGGGPAT